jgi:hypothetical protein
MKICIPFTPMPARENPNINSKSDLKSISSYYEAIVVEFFSLRKFNHETSLVLVTTHEPPAEYQAILHNLGVLVELVPFTHQPPAGYTSQFLGCFYLLDAILAEENEDCLYLDPDIVCLKSILPIQQSTPIIKAFEMDVSGDTIISGLSIRESYRISGEIFEQTLGVIPEYKFYGGEFYFIPIKMRKDCIRLVETLYLESLRRFSKGFSYYPTEEHLLSAAFSRLEVENANNIISRVWTAPSFRNVKGNEMEKILLHFPAEKEWGFRKTYKKISKMTDPLNDFPDSHFLMYIEKEFQLVKRSVVRFFLRFINRAIEPFHAIYIQLRFPPLNTFLRKINRHARRTEI